MKATITTGASVLALAIAAPAVAQSISAIDQTGTGNSAAVTQSGSNASDVDQNGTGNSATVSQAGTDAISGIDQTGTANTATTTQTAIDALADVVQNGTDNRSTITQTDASALGTIGAGAEEVVRGDLHRKHLHAVGIEHHARRDGGSFDDAGRPAVVAR